MKRLWLGVVVLAVFPLAGCIDAPPGDKLPFHAQGSGTLSTSLRFDGPAQGNWIDNGTFEGLIDPAPSLRPECPETAPIMLFVGLRAENGDAIFLTWSGTFCATVPSRNFVSTATYTITGGTGRFLEATGTGSVLSTAEFPVDLFSPGNFSFTLDGNIRCV